MRACYGGTVKSLSDPSNNDSVQPFVYQALIEGLVVSEVLLALVIVAILIFDMWRAADNQNGVMDSAWHYFFNHQLIDASVVAVNLVAAAVQMVFILYEAANTSARQTRHVDLLWQACGHLGGTL